MNAFFLLQYASHKRMLGFEAVTLVPFETKLINLTLLNDYQVRQQQ